MRIFKNSEVKRPLFYPGLNIPWIILVIGLVVACFGSFSCEAFVAPFGGEPYLLQMQVLWPLKKTPEKFIVVGPGSGLTIELKTNVERIEAFIDGQKIEPASVSMTTLKRLSRQESIVSMSAPGSPSRYEKVPSDKLAKVTYLDLILPALSNSGLKKLILVGRVGLNKIEKAVPISCNPKRLDQLARGFLKEWWCPEGKSLRFRGNILRWKSEVPELNPYVLKAMAFLKRWWLGTIDFAEDQLAPDVIIKQGDTALPSSLIERIADTISSGTIFIPVNAATWPEETIVYSIAHEFGHCLGISIAKGIHPPQDSFMGPELQNFRWHPYQRRAAYLVYTQPAGTEY